MNLFKFLTAFVGLLIISSCNNKESLQEYYVENQEDENFMALDVPASMFANMEAMDEDQKATINSIKKINVLAFKAEENRPKFEEEKSRLDKIFKDKKYQLLMKYGGGGRKAELYFTGSEEAIDELIVYGYDDEKGLGVARVLGKDMNPQKIINLMKSLEKGDLNLSSLKELGVMLDLDHEQNKGERFSERTTKKDSIVMDTLK